jgi:ribosomal protein S6--L-glutamate ligase
VLGWREWVGLPDLGVSAVLAKLDTGAHGAAIHATDIEVFGPPDQLQVRFVLHPAPERPEETVPCVSPLWDRRRVTSSNGRSELRPFIRTPLQVADLGCEVELSLTARPAMRHRMLLGRVALAALGVLVDPARGEPSTQAPPSGLERAP